MLGPRQRRWSSLLEALPARIGTVHRWLGWRDPEHDDVGHLHHIPTVVACMDGIIRVERPGEQLDLAPGEVLVIAPGVWHRHRRPRGRSVAWMQGFMSGWSDVLCWDADGSWSGTLPTQPSLLLITRLLRHPDRSAAAELLRNVLAEEMESQADAAHPAVAVMLRTFWSRLHRGVTAGDLARAAGLQRSRAWQLFTAAYGLPPHRALLDARRSLGEGLLEAGHTPGEAARCAGFPDASSFARERRRFRARSGRR